MTTSRSAIVGVSLASFFSGAIGLGYQVMWFRILADRWGSTNLTFVVVLLAFIGGLGLGALASGVLLRALYRWPRLTGNPLAAVGAIELGIALCACLTLVGNATALQVGGDFPYARDPRGIYTPVLALQVTTLVAATICVCAPSLLMGTTFPILCQAFRERGSFPSALYGWNTFGACSGVLLAELLLLPRVGHTRSLILLILANAILALAFFALARRAGTDSPPLTRRERRAARAEVSPPALSGDTNSPTVLLAGAVLAGLLAGALEGDMFRRVRFTGAISDAAMAFTSFWAIVAIFAASWTVRVLRPSPDRTRLAFLAAGVVHLVTWIELPQVRAWFNEGYVQAMRARAVSHPEVDLNQVVVYPFAGSLLLLLKFTGALVFPAYYLVSLHLPAICNALQTERRSLGLAYGLNTLAFCAGLLLFTWVVPSVSLFYSVKVLFLTLATGAALALTFRAGRPLSRVAVALALGATSAGAMLLPRGFDARFFPPDELPARHPVRALRSNGAHTTYVVAAPDGDILYFDSHPMSGTAPEGQRYMRLMAHFPLLATPDPSSALLICFGVGNTAAAIASHERLTAIDIVDLNDRVFETAPEFARTNGRVDQDPRVRMIHDDGRRFLYCSRARYDLVTSEPPPPRAEGVYRLYSVEYYRSVLAHLSENGWMTQWLPMTQVSREGAARVIASFVEVFPHALLFVGSGQQMILLGGRQPFDPALLERRFSESPRVRRDLASIGIREPIDLLARITRIDDALRHDVAGSAVISDERNDLALLMEDPFDPPPIVFDSAELLRALRPDRLACGKRLEAILASPRDLQTRVPDFPAPTTIDAPRRTAFSRTEVIDADTRR